MGKRNQTRLRATFLGRVGALVSLLLINGKNLFEELAVHFGLLVPCDREVAWDSDFFALLLEQPPESGVMYAIALDDRNRGGLAIPYPNRRIVLGYVGERRALQRQGFVLVPVFHQLFMATCPNGLQIMGCRMQAKPIFFSNKKGSRVVCPPMATAPQTREDWRSTGSLLLGSAMSSW